jgi:hypothetical protein
VRLRLVPLELLVLLSELLLEVPELLLLDELLLW